MRMRAKWLLGAVAAGGLAVAGTSAFTAGSTLPTQSQVGYGTVSVTGGTVTDIAYTLDTANPPNVTALTVTVDTNGDSVAPAVQFALNGAATMTACTAGTFSSTTTTPYTCTLGTPLAASTVTATDIAIAGQ